MSKLALDRLIDEVADGSAKAFGNSTLKREYQSFELSRALIEKAVDDQIKTVLGKPDMKLNYGIETIKAYDKIKKILTDKLKRAPSMEYDNPKGIDYIDTGKSIIIRAYGTGNNYDKIYNQVFKPGMAQTRPIFDALLIKVLEMNNVSIQYRGLDDKPGESPFILGHSRGGSNIKYYMADKLREVMTGPDMTVADIKRTFQEVKMTWESVSLGTLSEPGEAIEFLTSAASSFIGSKAGDGTRRLTITMEVQSRSENAAYGAKKEAKIRKDFELSLKKLRTSKTPEFWINHSASDSPVRRISKVLMQEAMKAGFKVADKSLLQAIDVKPNKASKSTKVKEPNNRVRRNKATVKLSGKPKIIRSAEAAPSYLNLMTLINQRLPPRVRSNMTGARLHNQTGRFSESTEVTNIATTPQGFPSIEFNYQRNPYDVFDKTKGRAPWNTPGRDPSELVALSVRQIATELGMKRFYTRRAQ